MMAATESESMPGQLHALLLTALSASSMAKPVAMKKTETCQLRTGERRQIRARFQPNVCCIYGAGRSEAPSPPATK
jgi:hypothetical protein